ncbi:histidine kinase, partial [Streptomyces sp. Wh19]|nr:histidine kinase [Streptomyces sp. Wh19]
MLLEAVLSIGSDLELRTMLQQIVDTATALTGARYGALGVLDPERGTIGELYTSGLDETEWQRIGRFPDGYSGMSGALTDEPEPSRRDGLAAGPRTG